MSLEAQSWFVWSLFMRMNDIICAVAPERDGCGYLRRQLFNEGFSSPRVIVTGLPEGNRMGSIRKKAQK